MGTALSAWTDGPEQRSGRELPDGSVLCPDWGGGYVGARLSESIPWCSNTCVFSHAVNEPSVKAVWSRCKVNNRGSDRSSDRNDSWLLSSHVQDNNPVRWVVSFHI